MAKLAAPMVSRGTRATARSVFNEGIQVPKADWQRETAANPDLTSKDPDTRNRAMKKAITEGALAKYRRR